jgi:hypothetical protein
LLKLYMYKFNMFVLAVALEPFLSTIEAFYIVIS